MRKPDEPYEQYRLRLKVERAYIKNRMRGRMLWPANQGTYIRKRDGELK